MAAAVRCLTRKTRPRRSWRNARVAISGIQIAGSRLTSTVLLPQRDGHVSPARGSPRGVQNLPNLSQQRVRSERLLQKLHLPLENSVMHDRVVRIP